MKAPKNLGVLFISGLLFFNLNPVFSQETSETVIDLGKVETVIHTPSTTGAFFQEEEIESSNCINLSEFLTQKGYLVMNTGGTGSASNVSINGYAGFCIKVYIDDVLANNPTTGEFDWNQINLESIASIEIQDFPVDNQLQFAGTVIKIKTKSFGKNQFTSFSKVTSYESSLADTLEQSAGYQFFTKKSVFKFNADARYAKNEYLTPRNTVNLYNRSKLASLDGSWNMYTNHGSLSAVGFLGTNSIKAPNTGTSYEVGVEQDINSRLDLKRVFWGDKIWHTYGFNYSFVDVEYDQSKTIHNSTNVHNLEAVYNLNIKDFGFKLFNSFINEWSQTLNAYRPQIQSKIMYENQIFNWLRLNSSLGFDGWITKKSTNDDEWSDFDYSLIPFVRFVFPSGFSVAGFKEFILPTFNQLYWNGAGGVGNPDLENEYGWSALFNWNKWEIFNASFKISWYGNKIRWSSENEEGILRPENTSSANYYVLNLNSAKSWANFGYDAHLNFTRAVLEDGNQIMWVPFVTGSLALKVCYQKIDWNLSAAYTGKRYKQNEKKYGYYDPYCVIDFTQNWNISENFILSFKVSNLLDDRYVYHDNYSAPGRNYSIILRFNK